jgi:excisionase family DNA binding protein
MNHAKATRDASDGIDRGASLPGQSAIRLVRDRGTPPLSQLLSVQDLARILGLSRSKVYQLIAAGELQAYRPGGRIRVPVDAVVALLEKTKV